MSGCWLLAGLETGSPSRRSTSYALWASIVMLKALLVVVTKSHGGFLYTPCKNTTNIKGWVATTVLGSGTGSSSTRGDSLPAARGALAQQ